MLLAVFGLVVLLSACLLAWRFGGADEKLAAVGFVAATLLSRSLDNSDFSHTQIGVFGVDILLLVGLLMLALRSDRFWPLWACAFQLVGTTVHVASMTEQGNFAWAYAVALIFWSYPVMLALMAGTWLEARFRTGNDPLARG